MRRRTVVVANRVRRQISDQVLYIAADSIDNALAWEARLDAAIQLLRDVTGYAVDEDASDRLGYQVHKLVFENTYVFHYVLEDADNVVRVVNFRHGARLPGIGEP